MTQSAISFRRLTSSATAPKRATPDAAGLDICADLEDLSGAPRKIKGRADSITETHMEELFGEMRPAVIIKPQHRLLVPTGLAFQFGPGLYGRVAPRSGHALKHGLDTLAGVIDRDYSGELFALLYNTDPIDHMIIHHGMRICQLVVEVISLDEPHEVSGFADTMRGADGFGSTGQ